MSGLVRLGWTLEPTTGIRLVGARGRVFAFEPVAMTAGYVTRTRALNGLAQLRVIPCGLGSPETLAVHELPSVRGMVDSTISSEGAWLESFMVARLDWLWERICGVERRVDGVKMDVQGMELDAVKGMSDVLRHFGPRLVIEMHGGVDRHQILDLLESLGYSRLAQAVEPAPGEIEPLYLNDRSYVFTRQGPQE